MNDDDLEGYLARLDAGESLDSVLAGLSDKTAELVHIAASLRSFPIPASHASVVKNQRTRLIDSAKGGKTMVTDSKNTKRWVWTGVSLAGAIGLFLVCAIVLTGGGILLFGGIFGGEIARIQNSLYAQSPLIASLTSAVEVPNPQTGVLRSAHGLIEVQTTEGVWRTVSAGELVSVGQGIRTGAFSSATVEFYDGSIVFLGQDTEILISKLDARDNVARIIQITQLTGETDHDVTHSDDPESLYEVVALGASGQVQGTKFHVTIRGQEITYTVAEGAVGVSNSDETVVVTEGQTTSFEAGDPPSPPAKYFSGEGEVELIAEFWYAGGQTFMIGPDTLIEGDPQEGDWVSFEGYILPSGVRSATRITLLHASVVDTFSFVGSVETIDDLAWTISGMRIAVDDQTVIEPDIQVGDQVEVSGTITKEGSFLASQINLFTEETGEAFSFAGVVEGMEAAAWVVSDISVDLTEDTAIDPEIVLGDVVRVNGQVVDGSWQAESITRVAEIGTFNFVGVVISTAPWNVSGVPFEVDDNTWVDEGIRIGNRVQVQGAVLPDGTWLAEDIMQYDEGQRHAIHFAARVDSLDPWLIGGTEITVDEQTQIYGDIEVGDLVSVTGNLLPSSEVLANKITLIAEASGCTLAVSTVAGLDGDTVTLDNSQVILLDPSLTVNGELIAGASVVVEICPNEEGVLVVQSITVFEPQDGDVSDPASGTGETVVICHIPGGDLNKAQTLNVGAAAVQSHLDHGDQLGPCP